MLDSTQNISIDAVLPASMTPVWNASHLESKFNLDLQITNMINFWRAKPFFAKFETDPWRNEHVVKRFYKLRKKYLESGILVQFRGSISIINYFNRYEMKII